MVIMIAEMVLMKRIAVFVEMVLVAAAERRQNLSVVMVVVLATITFVTSMMTVEIIQMRQVPAIY